MLDDWESALQLMRQEPKVPVRAVYDEPGDGQFAHVSLVHDGDASWVIGTAERGEVNNGVIAVTFLRGAAIRHRSRNLHSFGLIKSLIHPQRFVDLPVAAMFAGTGRVAGRLCSAFSMEVKSTPSVWWIDAEFGFVVATDQRDQRAGFSEIVVIGQPERSLFEWTEPIDEDLSVEVPDEVEGEE